jgi:GDP-L-fucose synthase
MTILVAGATGLVGSAIVRELEKSNRPHIGISSKDLNLLDRVATFSFLKEHSPTVVIDAAARVGGIGANSSNPVSFLSENLQIQTNLMDAAHETNVRKFVFLGSSCMYPINQPQPYIEESLMQGPVEPTNSAYALAKLAGMELIKSYRKEFGHSWITLIPNNVYGQNDNFNSKNSHVFASLIRKFTEAKLHNDREVTLWGSGKPKREFIHADDAASAIVCALDKYNSDIPLNIGTGVEISICELAQNIAQVTGFSGHIIWNGEKPDGVMRKILSIDKLLGLGWKPSVTLDDGISGTVSWYLSNLNSFRK